MNICPKCGAHFCSTCGSELAWRNYVVGICSRCQRQLESQSDANQEKTTIEYCEKEGHKQ